MILLGVAVAQANRPDAPGAMPEPFAQAMADASLMQVGADWPAYGGPIGADLHERGLCHGLREWFGHRAGSISAGWPAPLQRPSEITMSTKPPRSKQPSPTPTGSRPRQARTK